MSLKVTGMLGKGSVKSSRSVFIFIKNKELN
jgi:hypothetical protein